MRAELALRTPMHDVGHQLALRQRLALGPGAPGHAPDIATLEQREVERNFGNLSGGKADYEISAEPTERTQSRLGIGAAYRIVDHVDAAFAAKPFERIAQILAAIIHRLVGAVFAGKGELFVGRGAGNNAGAHDLAEFDG